MFKHGGDNINIGVNIHPACGMRRAFLGGFGGMLPRENFFKWCNLVRFGVYLDQILCLYNCKNYHFLLDNHGCRYHINISFYNISTAAKPQCTCYNKISGQQTFLTFQDH